VKQFIDQLWKEVSHSQNKEEIWSLKDTIHLLTQQNKLALPQNHQVMPLKLKVEQRVMLEMPRMLKRPPKKLLLIKN